jgi:hypothetical protein
MNDKLIDIFENLPQKLDFINIKNAGFFYRQQVFDSLKRRLVAFLEFFSKVSDYTSKLGKGKR